MCAKLAIWLCGPHFTIESPVPEWLELDHGRAWVQIQSGTRIFSGLVSFLHLIFNVFLSQNLDCELCLLCYPGQKINTRPTENWLTGQPAFKYRCPHRYLSGSFHALLLTLFAGVDLCQVVQSLNTLSTG